MSSGAAEFPHLHPSQHEIAQLSNEERIAWIRQERWIQYPVRMSASQQLTEQQRTKLLTGHHLLRRREMVRYWLLEEEDIRRINARRKEHNRLGFAIQLCVLRYPDWPLRPDDRPPANLLKFVAEQLGADATEIRRPRCGTLPASPPVPKLGSNESRERRGSRIPTIVATRQRADFTAIRTVLHKFQELGSARHLIE